MLDITKKVIAHQFEAAFCTLNMCIDRCPDASFNAPVGARPFCQVVFHALFFADYYLGPDEESFRGQRFHRDNEAFFADYEQLEDRDPVLLYQRSALGKYMGHCRRKVSDIITSETEESLSEFSRFEGHDFSRAELHVYNIRHIQHHAAQLILRLRLDAPQDLPWIGSGWREG